GIRRFRLALDAAFCERPPLPRDAPAEDAPRWWRRPELADPPPAPLLPTCEEQIRRQLNPSLPPPPPPPPPPKLGREVARIFSSFAMLTARWPGRRGRRSRHLVTLDNWIEDARSIAVAFGDNVFSIYNLRITEEIHPM